MAAPLSRSDQDWRRRLGDLAAILGGWVERGRTRRALALLDERQLRDLGLSSTDQRRESAKPFWQS